MPQESSEDHSEFQNWTPESVNRSQPSEQDSTSDPEITTTEEISDAAEQYRRITKKLEVNPTQEDKLFAGQLRRRLEAAGVDVKDLNSASTEEGLPINKASQQPNQSKDAPIQPNGILGLRISRRTAIKAGGIAAAGAVIGGTETKTGLLGGIWKAYEDWSDRWRTKSAANHAKKGLSAAADEMIPPTPTPPPPTEAPTPTPNAEQLANKEFQAEVEGYLNKFVEMGKDEDLGAGGALPLVMAADRFEIEDLVEYAKKAGDNGDYLEADEAAYFAAAGLENGIDPVAGSEMFAHVTDDLGFGDERTAAMVAIAIKYGVDAKQVADDLYPITKSTQARGSITLLPLYYQGYSVEQIDQLFKEVQKITKEKYNDGIDEIVTYLQAQDVLPAQQLYEMIDHIKDESDTIRDISALYLALAIHIGKPEEQVLEQFELLKDRLEGLKASVKESAAAVLILKAASKDTTIAGIQEIASESNYAMSAWWSLFGPNGLMPIKF